MPKSMAPTFIGLDVSSRSISVAVLTPAALEVDVDTIANTRAAIAKLVARWPDRDRLRICYEAGPHGYEIQRQLAALGIDCAVIAPSLTPRRPGERVKTDRRDARTLCRLLRAGELTAIHVPTPGDEAVRDLIRLREDLGEDILRARHRCSKFMTRHGRIWTGGRKWTQRHLVWVRQQRFELPELERALHEHLAAIDMRLAQRDALEREILAIAQRPGYAARVRRLGALRGIGPLAALTLVVEVGDFRRFATAAQCMAFTGLVPSEHSSGERRRQGSITKAGNAHLRRVLVEAAWAYRARPARTRERLARLTDQPPVVVARALAGEERLHRRFWRIVNKGKRTTVAAVAVARELAGLVWAVMQEPVAA